MTAASQEHYVQCEELLRARDRDLWLACLFAPQDARPHIHALYAFAQETADVSGKVTQPLLGEMRLQWWVDALEADAAQGEGVRANPVADALIDTIERFSLPRSEFVALADAHIFRSLRRCDADLDGARRLLPRYGFGPDSLGGANSRRRSSSAVGGGFR